MHDRRGNGARRFKMHQQQPLVKVELLPRKINERPKIVRQGLRRDRDANMMKLKKRLGFGRAELADMPRVERNQSFVLRVESTYETLQRNSGNTYCFISVNHMLPLEKLSLFWW
ncbi:hypothetical protein [Rhodomicrobium vannielii]|uniref:hypothetical protein n=1 Tax=Rhodomicrobium vannielii TaxID=1069 RepID=UPI00145F2AA0|nr:hypothetical protein [Rhodomicrobium vannielii]